MASRDELKRNAAEAALAYVKPAMVLGLGTGSTARHEDAVARGGPCVRLREGVRSAGGSRREGRVAQGGQRAVPDGQREPHPRRALRADSRSGEARGPDVGHPRRRRPRPLPENGPRRRGGVPDGGPHARAYANVLSFLRFASIRSIFACSSRSMCARMSAHGRLRRYEWTGRPLPSFLMSLLSTHFPRRRSCIAMLTSGCRRPVAFSISTDVVSSRS